MPTDILLLVVLSALTIVIVAIQGLQVPIQYGFGYGLGNRDTPKEPTVFMRRLQRIWDNHIQALAMVIPLIIALQLSANLETSLATQGVWVFLLARVAFTLIYLIGIPYLRSLVWGAGLVGIFMMLIAVF